MRTDVIVSVSDKYLWALQPFALLFNKYWGSNQRVIVAGYSVPQFKLPDNFLFYSIATEQYPKEKWADGLRDFLNVYQYPYFTLLLEDYWLSRKVDVEAIHDLTDYMDGRGNVLRMDLTGDRLYAGGMRQIGYHTRFDLVEAVGSQYQMSLQAGIWNRELLLGVLDNLPQDRHSAWDVELEGTTIINRMPSRFRVIGTRQWPVMYANGMNNAAGKKVFFDRLSEDDVALIRDTIPSEYI